MRGRIVEKAASGKREKEKKMNGVFFQSNQIKKYEYLKEISQIYLISSNNNNN